MRPGRLPPKVKIAEIMMRMCDSTHRDVLDVGTLGHRLFGPNTMLEPREHSAPSPPLIQVQELPFDEVIVLAGRPTPAKVLRGTEALGKTPAANDTAYAAGRSE